MGRRVRPLRGLRVLEFAPHFPGQYLGRVFAHLGAQVTKVESPAGDTNRRIGPFVDDEVGFLYAASNTSKRMRRVDLRTTAGRALVHGWIARTDVVIQAFRPGTARKLGIDWATCRRLNRRLLYVELSGWGPRGPHAKLHGHDLAYQAAAGLLDPASPAFPWVGLGDLFGTLWAATTTLGVLHDMGSSAKGRRIPISLAGAALVGSQLARSANQTRAGLPGFMRGRDPFYNLYRCRDGRFLALAIVEPLLKPAALRTLGIEGNETSVSRAMIQRAFSERARDDWIRRLEAVDVPCAPVLDAEDAVRYAIGSGAWLPPFDVLRAKSRQHTGPASAPKQGRRRTTRIAALR